MVLIAFLAIVTFFLISEHSAYFFGILPYALVLVCCFVHLFKHRRHGNHSPQRAMPNTSPRGKIFCQALVTYPEPEILYKQKSLSWNAINGAWASCHKVIQ
jgi:hypothetical protein